MRAVTWGPQSSPDVTRYEQPPIDYTYYPAHPDSYTIPNVFLNRRHIDSIITHTLEGYARYNLDQWSRPNSKRDAHAKTTGIHFVIDAKGYIYASTPIGYAAHHVRLQTGYQFRSIGIECEGFANDPQTWTTELMDSLVRLVRWLCQQYGIPRQTILASLSSPPNQPGIFGHVQVDPNRKDVHLDPGPHFNWLEFLNRVNAPPRPRLVLPQAPQSPQWYVPWSASYEVPVEWGPVVMSDWDVPNHAVVRWQVHVYYHGLHNNESRLVVEYFSRPPWRWTPVYLWSQGLWSIYVRAQNAYGWGDWSDVRFLYQNWQEPSPPPPSASAGSGGATNPTSSSSSSAPAPAPVPPSAVTFVRVQTSPRPVVVEWAPMTSQAVFEYEYMFASFNPWLGIWVIFPSSPIRVPAHVTRITEGNGSWFDGFRQFAPGLWFQVAVRARNPWGYGPWNMVQFYVP